MYFASAFVDAKAHNTYSVNNLEAIEAQRKENILYELQFPVVTYC